MRCKTKLVGGAMALALLGPSVLTFPAQATPGTSQATFSVPVHSEIWASEESWCDNTGPHITLRSVASTGGASLQLTLKNNAKGTHTVQVVGSSSFTILDPVSGEAQIMKQPPLGGVGGNPFMYVVDGAGAWHYIGRCVQDGKIGHINHGRFSADTNIGGWANANVQALTCSNKGSSLTIGTNAGTTGTVTGYLVFTNSSFDVSVKRDPTHINDDSGIIASWGFALNTNQVRKGTQNGVHGPGGNPLVSTAIGATSGGVTTYGAETPHGRCNKLY